jgi:cytochrome c oxidase subunit 2
MGNGGLIFAIFAVLAVLAIAIMVFLGTYRPNDPLPQEAVVSRGYALRRYWFWIVLIVAIAAFGTTIPFFPYPHARASTEAQHVAVVAQQYGFSLPAVVPLDQPVIFDVTSKDVNHGFGIYGPNNEIVSQVQAMPGYVNHLPVTFRLPGHYTIRCLEYCGIAHAAMQGGFDVR